jgi:cell division control protein 24
MVSVTGGFTKVKLYYGSDIFVIAIPSNLSTLTELTSKIERKLRLCGVVFPEDRPLKLRYKDEDGDLIQIYGDDDILLALDTTRGGRATDSERGIVHIYIE